MNNWNEVTVNDISEYVTVGFVGSMASEYIDKGVLFLRSQNIEPFKLNLNDNQVKYISDKFHNKISKSKLISGDIAMVRTGYPGTCCVIPDGLGDLNCSDLVIIRPNHKVVNTNFLCYFLNSPLGKASIDGNLVGAAQQHFNVGVAKKVKINLPPLKTQTKIANILSAYDDLIENNNQRIKLLEEMAEEIYKEWFVRFRFPNYKNTKFLNKEGKEVKHGTEGALPEGWENGTIGSLYLVKSGYAFSGSDLGEVGVPIIKIRNIDSFNVDVINCDRFSGEINNRVEKFLLSKSDLLIAMTGATIGKIALFPNSNEKYYLNQRVGKFFAINNTNYLPYIYQFTKTSSFREIINNYALGAAQPNISGEQIENIRLIIPSSKVIEQFFEFGNTINDEIFILKEKNQVLQETRDLLLPRLISGKLSVEELEIDNYELGIAAEPVVEYKTK